MSKATRKRYAWESPACPPLEAAAARVQYALSESAAGNYKDARSDVEAGIAQLTGMKMIDQELLANAILADARIELAGPDIAVGCTLARQALSMRPTDDPDTGWRHAEAQSVYGECLAELGQNGAGPLSTANRSRRLGACAGYGSLDDAQRADRLARFAQGVRAIRPT